MWQFLCSTTSHLTSRLDLDASIDLPSDASVDAWNAPQSKLHRVQSECVHDTHNGVGIEVDCSSQELCVCEGHQADANRPFALRQLLSISKLPATRHTLCM